MTILILVGVLILVLVRVSSLSSKIEALTRRITELERAEDVNAAPTPPVATPPVPAALVPAPKPAASTKVSHPLSASAAPPRAAHPAAPTLFTRLNAWLFGGNTVVRVGVVVLFFGVAFFLNFVIEQGWFPVAARLALAAAGGLALVAVGWWFREKRRDFAVVLQGGGAGIVYLTVFAASNFYALMPSGAGLGLMVVLVALTCGLAVLQEARSLAVLATLGGFLAPVLVSSEGSHVTLFSYYAVLNVGILAIAWLRAWRELNLLGFVSTFLIGALWGIEYYRPEHFATTEPFLVGFFVMYVAVPVLFARRQKVAGPAYVDGTLIFGVPLVVAALQAGLVADFEYGMAISALIAAVFYVLLASILRRQLPETTRLLVEALLANGVAFGTFAIPLAVDGRLTGIAWALEGAGLVWIGVRQERLLPRVSGALLQVASGAAFLSVAAADASAIPVLNRFYVGALTISLSGLFVGWYFNRHAGVVRTGERGVSTGLLVWALLWWYGAGLNEIATFVSSQDQLSSHLVFVSGTAFALVMLRPVLAWRQLASPVLVVLPTLALIAMSSSAFVVHPFAGWGAPAWIIALGSHYWSQWRLESEWPWRTAEYWHRGMLWLTVFLLSLETTWVIGRLVDASSVWNTVAIVVMPLATIPLIPFLVDRVGWPFQRFAASFRAALGPIAFVVVVWTVFTSFERGSPAPLPYLPLANPLELTQCIGLAILLRWMWQGRTGGRKQLPSVLWSILAFIVLNSVIARSTHFLGGVRMDPVALWESATYQTAISIVWTTTALVAMAGAAWLKQRAVWFAGAAVLSAVVVKLFAVDLDDVGTVARIVSFIGVGLLMLLVGYVSPLPPRAREQPGS